MQVDTRCGAVVAFNGIFKILLTVISSPSSSTEYILANLLKSRVDFEEGDEIEVTFKVTKRKNITAMSP